MTELIKIRCKNNKKIANIAKGSTIFEIFTALKLQLPYPPICARVNNKVQSLSTTLYSDADVEFLDITSSSGSRAYCRSLFFVLSRAVRDIYPDTPVLIDIPVSNGYYCYLDTERKITKRDVDKIRRQMQKIIDANMPFERITSLTEDAVKLFEDRRDPSKVTLLKSSGTIYTHYYDLGGYYDFYYGALVPNAGYLDKFALRPYNGALLLTVPSADKPNELAPLRQEPQLLKAFSEHTTFNQLIGYENVGDLNIGLLEKNNASNLIKIAEALQEKKIALIADEIAKRDKVRIVLLAGPSSPGKTTSSKRLASNICVPYI